jgi:hypothetical protein
MSMNPKWVLLLTVITAVTAVGSEKDSLATRNPHFGMTVNGGFGILGVEYDGGLYYEYASTVVGIRYLKTHAITVELRFEGTTTKGLARPIESIWAIDAYVGKKFYSRNFAVSFWAGAGMLAGIQRGELLTAPVDPQFEEHKRLDQRTYEVPLEARFSYTPWEYYDLGVSYMVSLNPRKTYSGVLVSLRVLFPI